MSQTIEIPVQAERRTRVAQRAATQEWTSFEKIAFRITFIFFVLIFVPLDPRYYALWFTTDWAHLHIRDLGLLAGRGLHFMTIRSESGEYGLGSYVDWGISLLIAIAGGAVWTLLDRRSTN